MILRSLLILLLPFFAAGQNLGLQVEISGRPDLERKINYSKLHADSASVTRELRKVLNTLYGLGYLTASVDSSWREQHTIHARIFARYIYQWAELRISAEQKNFLERAGIRRKDIPGKTLKYAELEKFMNSILRYGEDNGYPFISCWLDSIHIEQNLVQGSLMIMKGPLVTIDSVTVKGKARISARYLQTHLGIDPGMPYDESKIRALSLKLKELSFLRESKPAEVLFLKDKAVLRLYLEKKRASQVDGIIGFLPDQQTKKTIITGDLRLKLLNAFSRGELIVFNWRQLQVLTQDLKAGFNYPYLFQTPFCADLTFKLYKKDSSWIEINPVAGLEYRLDGKRTVKGFVDRRTLNLLSTSVYAQSSTLPPVADIQNTMYGLSMKWEDLDYRFNPRKGYMVLLSMKAGNKKIIPNAGIGDAAYQNISLESSNYTGGTEVRLFIPLGRRTALMTAFHGAGMLAENIFQNELFRIGGMGSIRGFDEESIPASAFGIGTLEWRFLLEQNSAFYFFGEAGYFENYTLSMANEGSLVSFGTGISFETKAGIFSLSYALGSYLPAGPDLREGKVHFGISGLF